MVTPAIVLVFLVLLCYLIYGVFPIKRDSLETYLISNRRLKGNSNGFSIAASKIGGGLIITYSTLFFSFGLSAVFYFIGILFGYLFFYLFAFKFVEESNKNNYYNIADFFNKRFGRNTGVIVGILTSLSVLGWVFTNLIAGGQLISNITGFPSLFVTLLIALLIGTYLFAGGFNSVIRTDKIQYFSLVIIGVIFMVAIGFNGMEATGNYQSVVQSLPIGQIVGFFLLGLLFPMGSAELWQRVFASENKKEFKKSVWVASISYILVGIILSFICYMIMDSDIFSTLPEANELKLAKGIEGILLPLGKFLPALWIIALLSAILSSADTFVYTTASSFVQDIIDRDKKLSKRKIVSLIRTAIIIILAIGVIASEVYPNVVSYTFLYLGLTLVISALLYFSKLVSNQPKTFQVAGTLGLLGVFTHFFISGEGTLITAIIGFVIALVILLIAFIVKKITKS